MAIKFNYKPPETNSGSLRTPIAFYKMVSAPGPEPGQEEKVILHECLGEIYNPSMKDMEIMRTIGSKEAITLRIRDTGGEYLPTNKHSFEVDDYRYTGKTFDVIYVAPDLGNNRFVKLIGEYTS